MTTKTTQYANQSLAAAGFVVMSSIMAWKLRPDLWATAQDCGITFKRDLRIEGTQRFTVKLEGIGEVPVLTRSTDCLTQRIQWITGAKVEAIALEQEQPQAVSKPVNLDGKVQADKRLEDLRALAAQEPPSHDCHTRKEILRARAELERLAV